MSRPMLSKNNNTTTTTLPSNRKPSLDSSIYSKLQDALARLPKGRSSPTKPTTSAQTTPSKKSSPFSLFSSSRHKPSASEPMPVIPNSSTSFLGNKGTLPQQKAIPTQPLPPLPLGAAISPTKSAPSSRANTPLVASKAPPPVPPVSSLRSRPTIPFASSSRLTEPTAASSARARPPIVSSSSAPARSTPTLHTRATSKSRLEAPLPLLPSSSPPENSRSAISNRGLASPTLETPRRAAPSPTPLENPRRPPAPSPTPLDARTTSPVAAAQRPRNPNRTPTSPPSAFPTTSKATPPPARLLGRKRSKTFPDPSDPNAPPPPRPAPSSSSRTPTLSSSMNTATRIMDAFEQSPRANKFDHSDAHAGMAARSKSTSPTPVRPPRASQDNAFMSIPSRARSPGSQRILPSAASIEATAARARQQPVRGPLHIVTSAPPTRSTFDANNNGSLPPPPRTKALSPTLTSSSGTSINTQRRIVRPKPHLEPLQTTPVDEKRPRENKPASPVTPETQPSSASPKTPAALAYVPEPACMTSDSETGSRKRTLRTLFQRKQRPDSIVTSTSLTSGVSYSGTSNAGTRAGKSQKGPGTFGVPDLPEEDEMPMSTQTRHGIRRHAHSAADVPYPLSFEEMVLQGEKHTQELLSTVLQQSAYHFTPMDNFSKLKSILDVGCGRGFWLADAAKECKNATLVGFDLVNVFLTPQEMRDRRGLTEAQIARIKFRQGNFFETLPFASGEFEYIRLAFLELAIPETKWVPLLKEVWRILKPGGHIEVVIESQLFPTVWSYEKQAVQQELEDEFRGMLQARDIPPATNIGEKMFFDAFARVQTHQHVSVCIAPRPAGRSSLDGPVSPRNFGSTRSMHSPWSSEPVMSSGMTSPIPFGRPSLDRSRPSGDNVLPPAGGLVTSKTCTVPGIVISPDVFVPVSEETLFTYASHGAMILNAARLAAFSDKFPNASTSLSDDEELEAKWRAHVERYWQYERSNRPRLGFRTKQFEDDDDEDEIPPLGPTAGRWKWAKCDEDLERPLEIRRFRAWSLSKPLGSR